MQGQERDLWRSLRDSLSPIIGGAPRAVCGARCLWRHAPRTLHGEGSGGPGRGLGGGGALLEHVSVGCDTWQAVRELSWSSGVIEHVAGVGALLLPAHFPSPLFRQFRPGAEKRRVGRAPRSASPLGLPVAFCPEGTAGLQLRGGCRRRPGAQVSVVRAC